MNKIRVFVEMSLSSLYASMLDFFNYYNESDFGKVMFFLGGSFRFNYHDENSDLDFFIHQGCGIERNGKLNIDTYLRMNDFRLMNPVERVDYPFETTGFTHIKHNIHVILFDDFTRWDKLRIKHDNIETYISENPEILRFIKQMKNKFNKQDFNFKGKWFYKTLEDLCKKK